jgi:hypothetical protein
VETDSKFPTRLQELGRALDLAEACDAELRPRDMRSDRPGFATYMPYKLAPWETMTSGAPWLVPQHAAVRAYWRELKSAMRSHVYVEDTLRRCRRRFKLASIAYDDLTIQRDSGYFISDLPSLRSILDARAELVESHIILQQVEATATYFRRIKQNKRNAASNRKYRIDYPDAHAEHRQRMRRFT